MSKLDVKSQKSMKQLTQPSIESLSKIIQKGKKINYLRCIQEPAIEGCRCRNEKREFPKNFYVCKILYPSEKIRKYPKCDHANDIVPNRDIFTHEKYMQFLATPKKVKKKMLNKIQEFIQDIYYLLATNSTCHAKNYYKKYSFSNRTCA